MFSLSFSSCHGITTETPQRISGSHTARAHEEIGVEVDLPRVARAVNVDPLHIVPSHRLQETREAGDMKNQSRPSSSLRRTTDCISCSGRSVRACRARAAPSGKGGAALRRTRHSVLNPGDIPAELLADDASTFALERLRLILCHVSVEGLADVADDACAYSGYVRCPRRVRGFDDQRIPEIRPEPVPEQCEGWMEEARVVDVEVTRRLYERVVFVNCEHVQTGDICERPTTHEGL